MNASLSFREKIKIRFVKALKKGHTTNAALDPVPSEAVNSVLNAGEIVIVQIQATTGRQYWFTSTRLLEQDQARVHELIRYADVHAAHWISRDRQRMISLMSKEDWPKIKRENFDRIEVETDNGDVTVLDDLDQAYWPTPSFLTMDCSASRLKNRVTSNGHPRGFEQWDDPHWNARRQCLRCIAIVPSKSGMDQIAMLTEALFTFRRPSTQSTTTTSRHTNKGCFCRERPIHKPVSICVPRPLRTANQCHT
jgi:hypothetical protein